MKIISNWLGFLFVIKENKFHFGHGIYGNEELKSLRLLYLSLVIRFLYEKRAKILVRCNFSNEKLIVVYNSIKNAQSKYIDKKNPNTKQKNITILFFRKATKVKRLI